MLCSLRVKLGRMGSPVDRTNGLPWRVTDHTVASPQAQHLCSTAGQLTPNRARTPSFHIFQIPGAVFFIPSCTLALARALH